MAATTTADKVAARYRKETRDTDATAYFVDDVLLLEVLQESVADYSQHRPIWTKATITILQDVIDYATDQTARLVTSLWDLTPDIDSRYPLDFEVVEYDGKKIRIAEPLPAVGTVLTYYYAKNHTKPADLTSATTLTVDDADIWLIVDRMKLRWSEIRLAELTKGTGSWKIGARSEDDAGGARVVLETVEKGKKAWLAELAKPTTLYGTGYPVEEHQARRPTLTGASRHQGYLGWSGEHPGQRRRRV